MSVANETIKCGAIRDTFGLSTSPKDLERLARRLNLTELFDAELKAYAHGHQQLAPSKFAELLDQWIALALAPVRPDDVSEAIERRLRIRVFYETAMAWDSIKNPSILSELLATLEKNCKLMEAALSKEFDEKIAEEIWRLDGSFHKEICLASQLDHLTQLIEVIIANCQRVGAAKTRERASFTLKGHKDIVSALRTANPEKVFDAISGHVMDSMPRWIERKESLVEQKDETDLAQYDWVVEALKSPPLDPLPTGILSEVTFNDRLPQLLQDHPGKWVAFLGEQLVALESSRDALVRRCESFCAREHIRYSDLACHRIVERG